MAVVSSVIPMHVIPATRPGRECRLGAADPLGSRMSPSREPRGHRAVIARRGGRLPLAGSLRLDRGDELAVTLRPEIDALREFRAASCSANRRAVGAQEFLHPQAALTRTTRAVPRGGAANGPCGRLSSLR